MGAEQRCQLELEAAIGCFRLGMEGMGCEHLVGFIDALQEIFPRFSPAEVERLNPILYEIIAAQTRKDYLLVADLLEYGNIVPTDCNFWVEQFLQVNKFS